jgi:hypothetical protein
MALAAYGGGETPGPFGNTQGSSKANAVAKSLSIAGRYEA